MPAGELGNLAEAVVVALRGIPGMAAMAALQAGAMVALQPQVPVAVAAVALEGRQLLLFLVLKAAVVLVSLGKVAVGLLAHIYKVLAALVGVDHQPVVVGYMVGDHRPLAAGAVLQGRLALVVVDYATQTMSL